MHPLHFNPRDFFKDFPLISGPCLAYCFSGIGALLALSLLALLEYNRLIEYSFGMQTIKYSRSSLLVDRKIKLPIKYLSMPASNIVLSSLAKKLVLRGTTALLAFDM